MALTLPQCLEQIISVNHNINVAFSPREKVVTLFNKNHRHIVIELIRLNDIHNWVHPQDWVAKLDGLQALSWFWITTILVIGGNVQKILGESRLNYTDWQVE